MTWNELWQPLASRYGSGEGKAMARYLLEVGYGLTMADILCGAAEQIPARELTEALSRLLNGEPVQHITGKAGFGGRLFKVTPDVLIPRPETFELCQWVVEEERQEREHTLLDIGTGSGCIAITLALDIPNANVEAWDISEAALAIARQNAESLNAKVNFQQADALRKDSSLFTLHSSLSIIISNPPYICRKEAAEMEPHVLDHEPQQALFVPDEDPLLFYRAIARLGLHALRKSGSIYFEINPLYHHELVEMLLEMGYSETETRKDQFGKVRFVRARKSL